MHTPAQLFSKLAVAIVGVLFATAFSTNVRADDYLETFHVGSTVYSNVTVMTKSSTDIFFKHSFGIGNAKVREVDRATLMKLGYQLPPETGDTRSVIDQSLESAVVTNLVSAVVTNLVTNERMQQAQALLNERMGDILEFFSEPVIYAVVAAFIGTYLFFCFCCRQICIKVGQRGSPLIWLPILQQFPLYRAAGMSGWWVVLGIVIPVTWPFLQIWWSFKIAAARSKSWLVGLFLILPLTNILAFFYLAFSGTGSSDSNSSNVISLGGPPRPQRRIAA
jgi:hypothetical protein